MKQEILPNIDWQKVYEVFGMEAEYIAFIATAPPHDENPDLWIIPPIIKCVTCDEVFTVIRKIGIRAFTYTNNLDKDERIHKIHESRGFSRITSPVETKKCTSSEVLEKYDGKAITLSEYLLLWLGYFLTTGEYLDFESETLCASTHYSFGGGPVAGCFGEILHFAIAWNNHIDNPDTRCVRSAVS